MVYGTTVRLNDNGKIEAVAWLRPRIIQRDQPSGGEPERRRIASPYPPTYQGMIAKKITQRINDGSMKAGAIQGDRGYWLYDDRERGMDLSWVRADFSTDGNPALFWQSPRMVLAKGGTGNRREMSGTEGMERSSRTGIAIAFATTGAATAAMAASAIGVGITGAIIGGGIAAGIAAATLVVGAIPAVVGAAGLGAIGAVIGAGVSAIAGAVVGGIVFLYLGAFLGIYLGFFVGVFGVGLGWFAIYMLLGMTIVLLPLALLMLSPGGIFAFLLMFLVAFFVVVLGEFLGLLIGIILGGLGGLILGALVFGLLFFVIGIGLFLGLFGIVAIIGLLAAIALFILPLLPAIPALVVGLLMVVVAGIIAFMATPRPGP